MLNQSAKDVNTLAVTEYAILVLIRNFLALTWKGAKKLIVSSIKLFQQMELVIIVPKTKVSSNQPGDVQIAGSEAVNFVLMITKSA